MTDRIKISELPVTSPVQNTDYTIVYDLETNSTKRATRADFKGDKGTSVASAAFSGNDIVFTNDDATTVSIVDAKITLKGDQGIQGLKGDTGDNATATAGTTTTGVPGTSASVVNSGTTSDAVFDFTIPRGDVGATGEQGIQGIQGVKGDTGEGVPAGGTTGQVLKKTSATDYDTEWGVASTVAALDDLTDVTITTAATGDILTYSGSAWVNEPLNGTSIISNETPTGLVNSSNTVYTTSYDFIATKIAIYLNRTRLKLNEDYTETAPNEVTLTVAPTTGDDIWVDYVRSDSVLIGDTSYQRINETPTGLVNGSNQAYDTAEPFIAGTLQVFLNGQLQALTINYTETDSNTFTMVTAPLTDDTLRVTYQTALTPAGNADTLDGYHANTLPDWKTLPALAWASTDGSTNVVNATGDMTSTLSPGMRVKTSQSQALTAYWPLDANSNTTVGSFNGTDTAITYTAGKFGNAATFNGTTSKIVIADNASLKPTGEFTIGCWFKTGTTGTLKALFQSYSANVNCAGIFFAIDTTNKLSATVGNNTGATVFSVLSGATTVTDNVLHFAVFCFRNNYMQIYLDGKLDTSGYCMTPAYTGGTNYVRIGCGNTTGTDVVFMNGQIDDLFLINGYALDEKTIKAKYAAATAQGTGNITIQKYALITAVASYAAGVTPITIWGGTDYSLVNATITSPYYATVSQPFGFDRNPAKWSVELAITVLETTAGPVAGTWYSQLSNMSVPIGKWNLAYHTNFQISGTAPQYGSATLSTANNTESDSVFSVSLASASTLHRVSISRNKNISLTAKTTYYLNYRNDSNVSNLYFFPDTGKTIIRAISTLL